MALLNYQIDESPDGSDITTIYGRVREFNQQTAGHDPPRPVAIFVRDERDEVVGAIVGEYWQRSVHIAAIWVSETYRGKGIGQELLTRLEKHAASSGHVLAYVETLSYQARPFYEKAGYSVFGQLDGIAENCTYFFLKKNLSIPPSQRRDPDSTA